MAQRSFVTHPIVIRELTVARVSDVTPRMRRVTLTGAQLAGFHRDGFDLPPFVSTGFDDHVKLVLATAGDVRDLLPIQRAHSIDWTDAEHRALRDYTPRRFDPIAGELDLDFVRHGVGPAASWAERAAVGDTLFVLGPKSSIIFPPRVDRVLLAGDETALPAIGRYLDERPLEVPVQIVVELEDASAVQELAIRPADSLTWVGRGELVPAVMALEWAGDETYVWAAAESAALLPLRRWLSREKQLPKNHVNITGYWHVVAETETETEIAGEGAAALSIEQLLSPIPWFAARAALALGILDGIASRPQPIEALAAACRVEVSRLRPLIDVLVSFGALTHANDVLDLGPAGEHILADEHLRESLDDTAGARTIASLAHLGGMLTGATTFADVTGQSLCSAVNATVEGYVERYEETIGFDFIAPAVVDHLGDATRLVATGPGSVALSKAVGDRARVCIVESPAGIEVLRREIAEPKRAYGTDFAPASADLVVAALALAYRTDAEAELLLSQMATVGNRAVVIEHVATPAPHDEEADHALLTFAATGSAPRTMEDLTRLAAASGWQVLSHAPLGWDHEIVALRRR